MAVATSLPMIRVCILFVLALLGPAARAQADHATLVIGGRPGPGQGINEQFQSAERLLDQYERMKKLAGSHEALIRSGYRVHFPDAASRLYDAVHESPAQLARFRELIGRAKGS